MHMIRRMHTRLLMCVVLYCIGMCIAIPFAASRKRDMPLADVVHPSGYHALN